MLNRWFHPPKLHEPLRGEARKVIWLELFYDLIYVAAIIQLGTALSEHVHLSGVLTFAGLFVPICAGGCHGRDGKQIQHGDTQLAPS